MKKIILFLIIMMSISCGLVIAGDKIPDSLKTVDELLDWAAKNDHPTTPITINFWPYNMDARPKPLPSKPGLTTVEIMVSPKFDCDHNKLTLLNFDNIDYTGQTEWTFAAKKHDTLYFEVQVELPPNDTCGFEVIAECGTTRHLIPVYYITVYDTVIFYGGKPRYSYGGGPQKPTRSYGIKDDEFLKLKAERDSSRIQFPIGDTTKIMGKDENGNWFIEDFDRKKARAHRMTTVEQMLEMEKTPLEDATQQDIVVDGEFYYRLKGEYKFKPIRIVEGPLKNSQSLEEYIDSVTALLPDIQHHLVFDLQNQKHYDSVLTLVDSLIPMERDGFYHSEIYRSKIEIIENLKIPYNFFPEYPIDRTRPNTNQKKTSTD